MRLIDADALIADFKARAIKARNWKENAILNGDEEVTIRADATIAFLTEVKLTIENAPTIELEPTSCELMEFGKCSYKETGCSDCYIKARIRKALDEKCYDIGHADGTRLGYVNSQLLDDNCIVNFNEDYFKCGNCHHLIFKDHRHREGLCNLCRLHRCFDDPCVHEEEMS